MRPGQNTPATNGHAPSTTGSRSVAPSVNAWNAEFLDAQYASFKADPASVPEDTAAFFRGFDLALSGAGAADGGGDTRFQRGVDGLVGAYRSRAHLASKLDPFGRERARPDELTLAHHGLSDADLDRPANAQVSGLPAGATLREAIAYLEATYSGSIGVEFMHLNNGAERAWFRDNFERARGRMSFSTQQKLAILDNLSQSQAFESFVGIRYGKTFKWFSLEGSTSLIPLLENLIEQGTELGIEEVVLGMPHRGRVNVLGAVMGKTFEQIFTEFEDNWEEGYVDGGGDVKYHRGYSINRTLPNGKQVHLAMASNPSHLESVDPVVLGRARATQRLRGDTERRRVAPLLLHGDGAVAGQGMVFETLNMSQLEGYTVGGTIHVVVNNLIAFTTLPEDDRSTTYCTDVAKGIEAPIFHVNGEDPEACAAVARLAMSYRQQFRKDVFIDLWCYRQYGHNEGDEQSYTQPQLAALIEERRKTPTVSLYAESLVKEGVLTAEDAAAKAANWKATLDTAHAAAKKQATMPVVKPGAERWEGLGNKYSFEPTKTAASREQLAEVCKAMGTVPADFNLNPKLTKPLAERAGLINGGMVCHADAEMLAVGTLLLDGVSVRLSGQDCRRGTFSQRHAVLRDTATGVAYTPLNNMREVGEPGTRHALGTVGPDGSPRQARYCIYDSPLSEVSVLGFDYGYSLADPSMLVMWEAQFGDFHNGAQVIIDQYIAAGEIKWSRWSGLVMLLPHGYEGQGPEHSSTRIERFLQLCGDNNMEVVNPTTAAQTFHMLRRQMMRGFRKPLIVATPKSRLRTPTSPIEDLMTGGFQEMLDDPAFTAKGGLDRKGVKRIIICSGKVFFDLADRRQAVQRGDVAILRLEQLYPFHTDMVKDILAQYPKDAERVYVQEEPRNAGAYLYAQDVFRTKLGIDLAYIGRETSATPAVGSKKADHIQQDAVITAAIGANPGADKAHREVAAPAKPTSSPKSPQPARR